MTDKLVDGIVTTDIFPQQEQFAARAEEAGSVQSTCMSKYALGCTQAHRQFPNHACSSRVPVIDKLCEGSHNEEMRRASAGGKASYRAIAVCVFKLSCTMR